MTGDAFYKMIDTRKWGVPAPKEQTLKQNKPGGGEKRFGGWGMQMAGMLPCFQKLPWKLTVKLISPGTGSFASSGRTSSGAGG